MYFVAILLSRSVNNHDEVIMSNAQSKREMKVDQERYDLFALILKYKKRDQRMWIARSIKRRFWSTITVDELEFLVAHLGGGQIMEEAAEKLLAMSYDPKVLGVLGRFCRMFEDEAWLKVKKHYPDETDIHGQSVFLAHCSRDLRVAVRRERRVLQMPANQP